MQMQDSGYFWGAVFSSLSIFAILAILWGIKNLQHLEQWISLYRIARHTGKNILLFSRPIQYEASAELARMIEQTKDTPTLVLLNTPGGSIFDTSLLARRIHAYRANLTIVVANYSMSGGTVLALAGGEILMDRFACLGPTDPQLGWLWKAFSSRAWREIIIQKGKRASDESIAMNVYSQQYDKAIRNLLGELHAPPEAIERMTSGDLEHTYQFLLPELQALGVKARLLEPPLDKMVWRCIRDDPLMSYLIDRRRPLARLFMRIIGG